MAKPKRHSLSLVVISSPLSFLIPRGADSHLYLLALFSLLSLLLHHLTTVSAAAASSSSLPHFEGFDADEDADDEDHLSLAVDLPLRSPPPPTTLSSPSDPTESHHGPPASNPDMSTVSSSQDSSPSSDLKKPSSPAGSFDYYWDEDEFEGFPQHVPPAPQSTESASASSATPTGSDPKAVNELESQTDATDTVAPPPPPPPPRSIMSFTVEIVCGSFLIMFIINYFTGKKENENIALLRLFVGHF